VDFPTKEELVANNKTLNQIRDFLGVESLGYMSLEGMTACASKPGEHYCTACWSGKYPIPIDVPVNKFSMEKYQMGLFEEGSGEL
jgi:amidophosphoribosyltransferase